MQDPVSMQVVDAIQYLVQQTLHHPLVDQHGLLVSFGSSEGEMFNWSAVLVV